MQASVYIIKNSIPRLFDKVNSIDLNARHGAVIAIGEILHSLSIVCQSENKNFNELIGHLLEKIKDLIPRFRERLYFRGMGGELMKQACCDFIEKCSLAHVPFHGMEIIGKDLSLRFSIRPKK